MPLHCVEDGSALGVLVKLAPIDLGLHSCMGQEWPTCTNLTMLTNTSLLSQAQRDTIPSPKCPSIPSCLAPPAAALSRLVLRCPLLHQLSLEIDDLAAGLCMQWSKITSLLSQRREDRWTADCRSPQQDLLEISYLCEGREYHTNQVAGQLMLVTAQKPKRGIRGRGDRLTGCRLQRDNPAGRIVAL